jgi:hypothetical protein
LEEWLAEFDRLRQLNAMIMGKGQASAKTEADKGQPVSCSVEEECQQASNHHRETRGVGYWQHAVWYDPAMTLSWSIRPSSTDLKQEKSSPTR